MFPVDPVPFVSSSFNKKPALRELDEHLQINLQQTSKAEQCWKALSMIAEILLPLLLYDIVCNIYIYYLLLLLWIFLLLLLIIIIVS